MLQSCPGFFRLDFYEILKSRKFAFMLLISKQNELGNCATSEIAENGKTILNLSYFFKIDFDLPEILCFEAVLFCLDQIFMRF